MAVNWRKNMYLVWIGCFFTGASINLVMPFISLYIEELGTPKDKVDLYSGLAISITALSAAIFAPIWGNLADRKGRKVMMVRAAVGMTFTMGSLAFVPNVYWLLIMRFFNGMLSGYIPNSTALVASQVPREKSGFALGTLATGAVAGNLIGPSFGGLLAQWFGMKNVFIITGGILFITAMITIFFVEEDFQPVAKRDALSTKEIFKKVKNREQLIGLFITTLILQVGVTSISPILTLYIRTLGEKSSNIIFISGLIVSISGVSAFVSSPLLGRLGDKIGNQKVLLAGLAFSLICILPMAFVQTPFQLGLLRFFLGFSTGALMPSINTLISKFTPAEGVSRIFSFNQTFNNFGQVIGPLVGSLVASQFDYSAVFLVTGCFIFSNIILCLYNFRGMLRERI